MSTNQDALDKESLDKVINMIVESGIDLQNILKQDGVLKQLSKGWTIPAKLYNKLTRIFHKNYDSKLFQSCRIYYIFN